MSSRKNGDSQKLAAARSGISERTGRAIENNERLNPHKKERPWRTRKDVFSTVWENELIPLLQASPGLTGMTLLEYLQNKYDGEYPDTVLRTLQRRVKTWQAKFGPEKEVIFRQTHEMGRLGLSDFTQLKRVIITIKGKAFEHLLYHFRLIFSHWSFVKVILGGESYTAFAEGLQEALTRLGGSPLEHRTDSLSAAFKNLKKLEQDDITERYHAFCQHYSMKATRNNRGVSHENGGIESPHGHLKHRIEQALLLRGNNDFESMADYQLFIDEVASQHNRRYAKTINAERKVLQALPLHKTADYTEVVVKVSSSSTITVRKILYTVHSRLIGETLRIHLYHDRLCCYLGHQVVITLNRVYGINQQTARLVDYRHVIQSLVKKPQAFRFSRLRDDLLPNEDYRTIWTYVDKTMEAKEACRFMVGILHLAAVHDEETFLSEILLDYIQKNIPLRLSDFKTLFSQKFSAPPTIEVTQHPLSMYNQFIPNFAKESHYVH